MKALKCKTKFHVGSSYGDLKISKIPRLNFDNFGKLNEK